MESCVQCGHPLGAGRFCTNCGHARATPSASAPRDTGDAGDAGDPPTVVPDEGTRAPTEASPWGEVVPPPVASTPGRARFPLYADDTASRIPPAEPGSADGTGYDTPAWLARTSHSAHSARRRGGAVLPWAIAGVTVVVAAGLGAALLLRGSGGDDSSRATDPGSASPGASASSSTTPSDTSSDPASAPPSDTATNDVPSGKPGSLDEIATVAVPDHAPDGVDVHGNAVSYVPANMVDGKISTAWRMSGDGTGETITISFDRPVTLDSIGLVNGYAKSEPGYDGYTANRRITKVTWTFGDDAAVDQTLTETPAMQSIGVSGPATRVVTLRIDGVTAPGSGRSGRDYTAISELRLQGTAG